MATACVEASTRELVVSVVREHADSLLRVARRHTACAADAEDAYQRALEIFVKNAHRLDAGGAHKWLHVVVRHEALAVRRARSSLVGVEDEAALDALDDARHVASVEERTERVEDIGRAAEALQRLKPQEVTALWLKAEGLSYDEIAERQGWTYTKVNRCITEGRRAFLRRYAGIQAGEECERWADTLSAMADGEATQQRLLEARPHLRNCPACRATLAAMRDSGRAVAALLPVGALPLAAADATAPLVAADPSGSLAESAEPLLDRGAELATSLHDRAAAAATSVHDRAAALAASVHERAVAAAVKTQTAVEAVVSGKLAVVAASAAALAGGGVAAEQRLGEDDARASAPPASVVAAPTSSPAPHQAADPSRANRPDAVGAVAATAGGAAAGDRSKRDRLPADAAFAPEVEPRGSTPSPAAPPPPARSPRAVGSNVKGVEQGGEGGEFGFVESPPEAVSSPASGAGRRERGRP
jgi:RNA polymerase sigma factor (sigma-70 family)